jgi:hypothetical protein
VICGSNANSGNTGDNSFAVNAKLNTPRKIALDTQSNIYIADSTNNKIRKILNSNLKIYTVVGTGSTGSFIDNVDALSATISSPTGIDVDSLGNLYIADTNNKRIRFVDIATNIISTIVGNGVTSYTPQHVIVDTNAAIYFSDQNVDQM